MIFMYEWILDDFYRLAYHRPWLKFTNRRTKIQTEKHESYPRRVFAENVSLPVKIHPWRFFSTSELHVQKSSCSENKNSGIFFSIKDFNQNLILCRINKSHKVFIPYYIHETVLDVMLIKMF